MRYEYVQPFANSAREILEELLSGAVASGEAGLSPAPLSSLGVTAIVGVTGEGEGDGRVLYDMSRATALGIATEMIEESRDELDGLAKDTLSELASMMTGRAISILNDRGHRLRVSPPTLVAGDNMTFSNTELETLVVPLTTSHGEVFVNVAMAML